MPTPWIRPYLGEIREKSMVFRRLTYLLGHVSPFLLKKGTNVPDFKEDEQEKRKDAILNVNKMAQVSFFDFDKNHT